MSLNVSFNFATIADLNRCGEIKENQTKEIDTYFKIADVKKYKISVTDEKGESTEGFMDTAMSAITILLTVIKVIIVF